MLPGKTFKPEDVLKVLRKRVWLIVVPWAIIAAGTAFVARKLPDMYRSTALLQIVQQQVPETIVQKPTPQSLEKTLQATTTSILSRTQLENIIRELGLYQEEQRSGEIMQDIVERMRRQIEVVPGRGDSFTVSFVGGNPSTVLKVTEKLQGLFKTASVTDGERRADATNAFVESTVADAERKLKEKEEALTRYKLKNAGELPEQLQANIQAIQTISANLQTLSQAILNDTNTRDQALREIELLENQADPAGTQAAATQPANGPLTAAQRLTNAKNAYADNELRGMKADHPVQVALRTAIKNLTTQADEEARQTPVSAAAVLSPAEKQRQDRIVEKKELVTRLDKAIEKNREEEKRLRGLQASYQAKNDRIPIHDAELLNLMRDYSTLSQIYNGLVAKREESSMTVNLARRQMGEQFSLLDAARLPERPFSPDRLMINLFGILGGLAFGVGLAALFEYRDSAFRTDSEIAHVLGLPVLAVVPLMRSDAERRAEFRRKLMLNLGLASTVMVCLAVLMYTFVTMR